MALDDPALSGAVTSGRSLPRFSSWRMCTARYPRAGLPDLVGGSLDEPLEGDHRLDDPDIPGRIPMHAVGQSVGGNPVKAVAEPIDAVQCGERVVDRGRERPDRHLDQLVDSEAGVLGEGPVGTDDVGAPSASDTSGAAGPGGRMRPAGRVTRKRGSMIDSNPTLGPQLAAAP